jgi:long-chain acyl-CoA synthetase
MKIFDIAHHSSTEFLISDLALATHSIPSFTVTSPTLLASIFQSHKFKTIITSAEFFPILKISYESGKCGIQTIVVVGDLEAEAATRAAWSGVNVFNFADVEALGAKMETVISPSPSLLHVFFGSSNSRLTPDGVGPKDVFTVSFFEMEPGRVQEAHLSHQNITAGVVAIRALLPTSNGLSSLDTIASSHSLSTAFGRIVAYSALLEGANFATFDSTRMFNEAGGRACFTIALHSGRLSSSQQFQKMKWRMSCQ